MDNRSTQIGILDFWHKIEFFQPFNLDSELKNKSAPEKVRTFNKTELWNIQNTEQLWNPYIPQDEYITGFNVYLALFNHKCLTTELKKILTSMGLQEDDPFFEERSPKNLMTEGNTCFAKIKLNEHGVLIPNSIEVSAAPWAIGKIGHDHHFENLDFSTFDCDLSLLKQELTRYYLKYIKDNTLETHSNETPLNGKAICYIVKILLTWARYNPEYNEIAKVVTIQTISRKKDKKYYASQNKENIKEEEEQKEKKNSEEIKLEINILNSFYARDILKAIKGLKKGIRSQVLENYLTLFPAEQRINLYSEEGIRLVNHHLSPQFMNFGHWFSEPSHKMSLMQQFAINTLFKERNKQPLFSVNGPPGTGKTTLLRDVFAENIVQRARVLANFKKPTDAFKKEKLRVSFSGAEKDSIISILKPELTGFEMVVASSNNSAVENISKELPQIASLGESWLDDNGKTKVNYLANIIRNIVSQKEKTYKLALGKEEPWGLFSVALGKKANREDFSDKFFWVSEKKENFNKNIHQSIWSWRDSIKDDTDYSNIRKSFLAKDKEISADINEMSQFIEQVSFFKENDFDRYVFSKKEEQLKIVEEANTLDLNIAKIKEKQCQNQILLDIEKQKEVWLNKSKPSLVSKILNTKKNQEFKEKLSNIVEQINFLLSEEQYLTKEESKLEQARAKLNSQQQRIDLEINDLRKEWQQKQKRFTYLQEKFADISLPESLNTIQEERWQIDGLWFSEALNRKRSELFHLALQLHEAWLANVSQRNGGFGSNLVAIQHLLSGKRTTPEHTLVIWQSLFMVVPVISTTFSSFAAQFCDLGQESLGWLFIDEAGQAAPQMAVGALWRAKHAMVVGDPLQIEPVLTTDPNLIEALKRTSQLPPQQDYSPNKISVQNLADWANKFGIEMVDDENVQWLGSPLRVHRRCVEPMFSIANHIAYQGNMIYFDPFTPEKRYPPKDSIDVGVSAWVNIEGKAEGKHIVMSQIQLVSQALLLFYQKHNKLPPVYVISPFKAICNKLVSYLKKDCYLQNVAEEEQIKFRKELAHFYNHAIGTVHTFQGKEQSIVWMVLGCDINSTSSAKWAASKPNLFNVALTRAKHRFFLIGNVRVWGDLPYFKYAKQEMPLINQEAFIQNLIK